MTHCEKIMLAISRYSADFEMLPEEVFVSLKDFSKLNIELGTLSIPGLVNVKISGVDVYSEIYVKPGNGYVTNMRLGGPSLFFDFNSSEECCIHDWKNYIGFTEIYEYCSKCDEKRK